VASVAANPVVKVLFLLDSLAPGGTETSTVLLTSRLPEYGIEPTIAVLEGTHPSLADVARSYGISVLAVPGDRFTARVRGLRQVMKRQKPDVLHTALFRSDQVGRWAAIGSGIPVVSSFVNTPYVDERFGDPNVRRWKLRATQTADAITARLLVDEFHAVSDGVRADNARALRLPIDRIHVVERGRDFEPLGVVDADRHTTARAALGVDASAAVLLNIGRQEYQKDQKNLVRASALLSDRGVDHVTVIAGKSGNASAAIEHAIDDSANSGAKVELLGHRDDVESLLCAADVVVVSSLFEGTAGAALEAMAMGVPIVATDIAGTRGILVHGENALLVPTRDAPAMAAAVQRLLSDPELAQRLAANGRHTFASRFTLEQSVRGMAEMYRAVASTA
jgi:glycosyltransferase involved in cell wall biosynthesis